ncbi:MAG: preprotein translocase subunit SecE [Patescibacteria group bacterium]|nr:preprotein translocase subunit SecE [Patescibacteria group bacterium]
MAESKKSTTKKRKLVTVRERTETANNTKPKSRKARATAGVISKLFRTIGRFIARIARPFRFLLRPFKTRPMRFVGRILRKIFLVDYFKDAWGELKLVTWPGRKETRQLTFAVFIFAFVFGLIITIVDYGLDKIFKKVILQ